MIEIDIFSDTICPWCLIGKRRLEKALRERPQPDLKITWRAFQLNPDMPEAGMDRQSYLAMKFGGPGHAEVIYNQIRQSGQSEGIDFNFGAITRTPNTIDSHRLIRYADAQGKQDAVVEALFAAYFFEGRDIGARDVLTEVGAGAGLPGDSVFEFLSSGDLAGEVKAEDHHGRQAGISGVPCFIFNKRHALSGAQPPEVFFQLFDLVKEESQSAAAAPA